MDVDDTRILLDVARGATRAAVLGQVYGPPTLGDRLAEAKPVFVTLREPDGRLRGCIGHLRAVTPSLAHEIADCAKAAATRDPRFPAVKDDELAGLSYEISILEPSEPATRDQLDPRVYGVVVRSGARRGVLLPDLDGVDTVDEQLSIACRKAGIRADEAFAIERFTVTKVAE